MFLLSKDAWKKLAFAEDSSDRISLIAEQIQSKVRCNSVYIFVRTEVLPKDVTKTGFSKFLHEKHHFPFVECVIMMFWKLLKTSCLLLACLDAFSKTVYGLKFF